MFNSVSGTSGSSNGISKGIGGLVSGMDTDQLVENMTAGTSGKIDAKMQEKQQITWKKEAYRTLTGALTEFNDKYFSFASTTNITSAGFFEAYKANNLSDKVGLSGKMNVANNVILDKIAQLATKSKYSYTADMTDKLTANFDTTEKPGSVLDGQSLKLKYGSNEVKLQFTATFGKELDKAIKGGKTQDQAMQDTLQTMINNTGLVDKKTNKPLVEVTVTDGKISLTGSDSKLDLKLSGGEKQMMVLGFEKDSISGKGSIKADQGMGTITETYDLAKQLSGKKINFYLDGTTKTVTLGNYAGTEEEVQKAFVKDLNTQLEKQFGMRGPADAKVPAIQVNMTGDKISFKLADKSSTFAIDSADPGILGKEDGVLKFDPKTSNKFNGETELGKLGLALGDSDKFNKLTIDVAKLGSDKSMTIMADGVETEIPLDTPENIAKALKSYGYTVQQVKNSTTGEDKLVITGGDPEKSWIKGVEADLTADEKKAALSDKIYQMTINDKTITVKESDKLTKLMNQVNQSDAGVNMTYSAVTGTFVLESKNFGASNTIELGDSDLAVALFGKKGEGTNPPKIEQGVNAKVTMTINGETMDVERESNTISVDGLNIELKKTTDVDEKISFEIVNDTDKVIENVRDFVDSYNALLKVINTEVSTKPNPNYKPLTDKQKEGMTQDQIKQWETEAKKGILFGDTTLNSILQSMRSALFGNVSGVNATMSSVGITTGEWSKKGQLQIDETKLRKALNDDPEKVANLFTQQSDVDYSSTLSSAEKQQRYKESGMMNRFQDILKGAIGTTTPKGMLLQIAGMENDRTEDDNQIKKKVDDIDNALTKLKAQLKTERDRYWKQFTAMEKYLNQMNQQSAALGQQFQ